MKYIYYLFIILSLLSCKKTSQIKIGVLQLIEHNALDSAYKGFVDGLKEAGYEDGKNIIIDYQNAQGEQANCITIGQKFINDKRRNCFFLLYNICLFRYNWVKIIVVIIWI